MRMLNPCVELGKKVRVWLKWVYASPVDTDKVYPKKTYLSAKSLNVYNCVDRTSVGLQSLRYSDADSIGEIVEAWASSR